MADNGLGYITELSPADVLFGRGSGPNDHEGNIRFRQLVAERKQEYLATNHRQTKAKIAREIVNTILDIQGRFLKKVEHFEARRLGIPKGVDAWIIVDDDTVMEKAKQALRQNTSKQRGMSPNRGGANSPQRGNSPARGGVSPVRGQTSPVPGASSPMRRQPAPLPTFDDLEPLPLGMNNTGVAAVRSAQQLAGMTPQQQQQAIQRQVQLQMQQQQQQQEQRRQQQIAQMTGLGGGGAPGVDLGGWGGNDPTSYVAPQMAGDWGQGGNVLPGQQTMANNPQMGGWGGQQQQSMAPPQPRVTSMNNTLQHPGQPQYSNTNNITRNGNWNTETNADPTVQTGQLRNDDEEDDDQDDSKKRRQSLQMEDLMDSFSQLKTGDFSTEAKLQESTDTMGTIEPISGGFGDSTSMSMTSFSSLFNKSEEFNLSRGVSRSSSINEPRGGNDIDASMQSMQSMQSIGSLGNLSEVWGPRGISLLDRLVQEERERATQEGGGGGGSGGGGGGGGSGNGSGLAETPRPVGLMEENPDPLDASAMGQSSMSVMKAAYGSSRRAGENPNNSQDQS